MAKSPDAFRTISEVAEWLGIQAHVLRFWESKFTQVKPVKRAGGRRYYRPNDMLLLGGIKKLLYEDGFTIKGVQKILREEGMSHVASLSPPLDELTLSEITPEAAAAPVPEPEPVEAEKGVVLNFDTPTEQPTPVESDAETAPDEPVEMQAEPAPEKDAEAIEESLAHEEPIEVAAEPHEEAITPAASEPEEPIEAPAFVHKPRFTPAAEEAPAPPPAPKPRVIEVPVFKSEAEFEAAPSILSALKKARTADPAFAQDAAPLLAQLAQLKERMAAQDHADTDKTSTP